MKIVSGIFWALVGLICLAIGVLWYFLDQTLVEFLHNAPIEALSDIVISILPQDIQQNVLSGETILNIPPMGGQLTILTGIFLIVLGTRIAANIPAWRLVGGYAHVLLILVIGVLLYLFLDKGLRESTHPLFSTDLFYKVVIVLGILLLIQVFMAMKLLQPGRDRTALHWHPLGHNGQCKKCGRRLNEQGICPYHDVFYKQAYLFHEETGLRFPVPSHEPAILGRGGDEHVKLIPPLHESFRTISRGHAEISFDQGEDVFLIVDRESSHGTWIENVKLRPYTPTSLRHNVSITLGEAEFTFQVREVSYIEDEQ